MHLVKMWISKSIFDPMLGEFIGTEPKVTEGYLQFLTFLSIMYPESYPLK